MNQTPTTPSGLPPPDPPQHRHGNPPPANPELLLLLQMLLVYARHLLGLLDQVVARGCARLAQCFGAAQASFALANLTRGILRAIALQRVLLAPAGGQPDGEPDPDRCPRKRIAPAAQPSRPRPPRVSHNRLSGLPTLRQLEAAIRRQPVEAAIDAIHHDFGVCFSLCEARFGNALRDMAAAYRDTLCNVFHEFPRRDMEVANAPVQDSASALPPQKPDAIRYIVDCLGVQQSVCGFPFTASPFGAASAGAQPP